MILVAYKKNKCILTYFSRLSNRFAASFHQTNCAFFLLFPLCSQAGLLLLFIKLIVFFLTPPPRSLNRFGPLFIKLIELFSYSPPRFSNRFAASFHQANSAFFLLSISLGSQTSLLLLFYDVDCGFFFIFISLDILYNPFEGLLQYRRLCRKGFSKFRVL